MFWATLFADNLEGFRKWQESIRLEYQAQRNDFLFGSAVFAIGLVVLIGVLGYTLVYLYDRFQKGKQHAPSV